MNRQIKDLSEHLEDLPLLPAVVARMLNFGRDDDDYFEKVLPLAEQDPAFALRIVRLANSTAFKARNQINDLHSAVARIGAYQVAALVTSMAVMQIFVPNEKDARNLWLHSIQVAIIARKLAQKYGIGNHDVAYLSGLMHDIGRFILFDIASAELRRVDETGWQTPQQLVDAEQQMLGIDHSELGWEICKKWMMPEHVSTIVRRHHHPNHESLQGVDHATVTMIRLVYLADCFSVLLLTTPDIENMPAEDLAEQIRNRVIKPSEGKTPVNTDELLQMVSSVIQESQDHCSALGLRVG
ncbi:MAG: HDOD domain-containing protein [Gammaproteobacteria bacterium]|nr:HDOD domain-containing protein [Gammaproteobacteria bacterium]